MATTVVDTRKVVPSPRTPFGSPVRITYTRLASPNESPTSKPSVDVASELMTSTGGLQIPKVSGRGRPLPSPSHWPLGPARSGLSWDQPPRSLLRLVLLGAAPRPPEEPPFSSLPPSSSAPFRIHSLARSPLSSKTTLAPRGPT